MRKSIKRGNILFGPKFKVPHSYSNMCASMCGSVQDNWKDSSFLIFRIFKLVIVIIQFILPYNLLCMGTEVLVQKLTKKRENSIFLAYQWNYIISEIYLLLKLIIPVILLFCCQKKSIIWEIILLTAILETIVYIISIVFLPSKIGPASYTRSAFFLLLAFLSCSLSFGYIYWQIGGIKGVEYPLQAVYFSFVTATTTGFGDIHATSQKAQTVVVLQIITSILFIVSFFPVFFCRLSNRPEENQQN